LFDFSVFLLVSRMALGQSGSGGVDAEVAVEVAAEVAVEVAAEGDEAEDRLS